jgi:release factor H-coupled RctB family protein
VDRFKDAGLQEESSEFIDYLREHDRALHWAELNRQVIAQRFLQRIRGDGEKILDSPHNLLASETVGTEKLWLHRKGAVSARNSLVVIPGSRGTLTYLVRPLAAEEVSLFSLPHGAGRKWRRSESRAKLRKRYSPSDLSQTELGGRVICEDKDLIYQEAPQAYKNISTVIDSLVQESLIEVVATFKPVLTYKRKKHEK